MQYSSKRVTGLGKGLGRPKISPKAPQILTYQMGYIKSHTVKFKIIFIN